MFEKIGSPQKIEVAKDDKSFLELREKISKNNDLIRCPKCSHLIAKRLDNKLDVQHKKVAMVITEPKNIQVKCPVCDTVSNVL